MPSKTSPLRKLRTVCAGWEYPTCSPVAADRPEDEEPDLVAVDGVRTGRVRKAEVRDRSVEEQLHIELVLGSLDLYPELLFWQPEVGQVRLALAVGAYGVTLGFVLPADAQLVEEDGPSRFQPGAEAVSGVAGLNGSDGQLLSVQAAWMG
ncbi:hypothetical protein GCM10023080_090090 [Streptomyces pseudoechinosporeus]